MKFFAQSALSTALLVASICFLQFYDYGRAVPLHRPLDDFPRQVGDWRTVGGTVLEQDVLDVLRPTDYLMRDYADAYGSRLWLYVGYWDSQRKGVQIHSPKHCLPGGGWEPLEADEVRIEGADGAPDLWVNRFLLQKESFQQMVVYWYESQGSPVASELGARFQLLRSAALRNRTDGAIVRVSAPVVRGVEDTWSEIERFVAAVRPLLRGHLPGPGVAAVAAEG